MDKSNEDLLIENDQLRKTIEQQRETINEQAKMIKRRDKKIGKQQERIENLELQVSDLSKKVEKVDKELRKYSNENTPSSAVPPFNKPTPHRHNKTPGREVGHEGSGRKLPENVDETKDAEIDRCPDCNGEVTDAGFHDRTIETPVPARLKVTKIHVHRYWCSNCKKIITARVKDAFKNSRFGIEMYLLLAFLKEGIGITYGKIEQLLDVIYNLDLSKGALPQMLDTLRDELGDHYKELLEELRNCPYVNGDETSWRENGRNDWLWVFINKWVAVYTIDKSRGKKVPQRILGKNYEGTVGSDFLGAYNYVGKKWQKGHCHLDRNLRETAEKKPDDSEFHTFKKILARILKDSRTLWKKEKRISVLKEKKVHFEERVVALCAMNWKDEDCKRLVKRCRRYGKHLFTFLIVKGLTPDNNIAERGIKPGVVMRKNSYGSRGENGIKTMPVLLSTIETCKIRDQNFLEWGKEYFENRLSSVTAKL
jgi:uncharacterized protein with PIN domain